MSDYSSDAALGVLNQQLQILCTLHPDYFDFQRFINIIVISPLYNSKFFFSSENNLFQFSKLRIINT